MLKVRYVINLYDEFKNVVSTSQLYDDVPSIRLIEQFIESQNNNGVVYEYAVVQKRYYMF